MNKGTLFFIAIVAACSGLCTTPVWAKASAADAVRASGASQVVAGTTQVAAKQETVNVNTADVKTLMTLKGIGAKRAQAIVDYRQQNGSFQSVKDLAKVKGMSEKTLERLLTKNPDKVLITTSP